MTRRWIRRWAELLVLVLACLITQASASAAADRVPPPRIEAGARVYAAQPIPPAEESPIPTTLVMIGAGVLACGLLLSVWNRGDAKPVAAPRHATTTSLATPSSMRLAA